MGPHTETKFNSGLWRASGPGNLLRAVTTQPFFPSSSLYCLTPFLSHRLICQPRALPDGHAWVTQDNSIWAMGQPSAADRKEVEPCPVSLPSAVIALIDTDMNMASTGGRGSRLSSWKFLAAFFFFFFAVIPCLVTICLGHTGSGMSVAPKSLADLRGRIQALLPTVFLVCT